MKPSTSLVIPTYNWPEALGCCLTSVLGQSEFPDEVLIADDGSGDKTRALIDGFRARFPVPLRHVWQEHDGFRVGIMRNKAMAAASGDYLIQVDGDQILHRDFVREHRDAAREGFFIGGSRVLFDAKRTAKTLAEGIGSVGLFSPGIGNRLNGLHAPRLSRWIAGWKEEKRLHNLRASNMSFWKKDIVAVNGYNEAIQGWGREDTELVIRLYNAGVRRTWFKFRGIVYHLHHEKFDRGRLPANDAIMEDTRARGITRCALGIDQYLPA